MQNMKRLLHKIFIICLLCMYIFAPSAAYSHSYVEDSFPRPGQIVPNKEHLFHIRFTSPIELSVSSFRIQDSTDTYMLIPLAAEKVTTMVRFNTKSLNPGSFRLQWSILSLDGHRQEGAIAFKVAP